MRKLVINQLFEPILQNPVLIVGLPGIGEVGKLVATMLINSTDSKLFAELYSPYLPDLAIIERNGICRLPRYEFWSCSSRKPNLIIMTGDFQPLGGETTAYYEICSVVLELAEKYGCRWMITLGGCMGRSPFEGRRIYVTSTSKEITDILIKQGSSMYTGRIIGLAGLMLGMARLRGLKGSCILATAFRTRYDREAATAALDFLNKILKLDMFNPPELPRDSTS